MIKKILLFVIIMFSSLAIAQDMQETLFGKVDNLKTQADELNASLYSPENYSSGMDEYKDAKAAVKEGESLETIREYISRSENYFDNAITVATDAKKVFSDLIDSREDCLEANANLDAKDTWENAEDIFNSVMRDFESGDVDDAKESAREAEKIFRSAELIAIKDKYLGDARELITKAEETDVSEYAPVTYTKAKLLLEQAESELTDQRYDNNKALELVKQTRYEARHAIYIDKLIREMMEAEKSWEDVILRDEKPFQMISDKYKLDIQFDNGFDDASNKVVKMVEEKDKENEKLTTNIALLKTDINTYKSVVDSLNKQLVAVSELKNGLQAKVDDYEREKREFQDIADLFTMSEAEVFKDGNNIVIRLLSLNFDAGKSIIDPQYFALLSKVQKGINSFSDCTVSVEGHTDSQGSDEKNLTLSQERAEAVRQYLLANIDMNTTKLLAIGYGETKPIANNETDEGRKLNRRIDIVINPHR